MSFWVTGWDVPGLLDQKVICAAGLTFDQSTSSAAGADAPGLLVLGPEHAARAAADRPRPARPRNRRRAKGGRGGDRQAPGGGGGDRGTRGRWRGLGAVSP